jgi:F420-0:gamma-glutamyl ligase-like protein
MEKIKNTEGSAMIVGLPVSKWFGFCFGRLVNVRSVVLPLAITQKVFAKGGLNLTASSISTERSKLLFQITKLQKKVI